jgi:hypothetical protein
MAIGKQRAMMTDMRYSEWSNGTDAILEGMLGSQHIRENKTFDML